MMNHLGLRSNSEELIAAIQSKDVAKVKELVKSGFNVHARDDTQRGYTALHHAVEQQNIEIVNLLLQHGASANNYSRDGIYPLDIALSDKNVDCVKILLQYEARIDVSTVTHYQMRHLPQEIFQLCYTYIDLNERDVDGFNILHKAVRRGDMRGVQILIERGAKIDERTLEEGQTALHLVAERGRVTLLKYLLEHKAHPNLLDEYGRTPLHLLLNARISEIEKVRATSILLDFGSDVNATCDMDIPVLEISVNRSDNINVSKTLVKHIAKLMHKGDYISAMNLELINRSYHLTCYYVKCVEELEGKVK